MLKKNLKKIIIGSIFIVFGVGLAGGAIFYYIEVKPELAKRQQATFKKVEAHEEKVKERAKEIQQGKLEIKDESLDNVINLRSLVEQSEKIYNQEEKSRKKGFLWIDRSSSQWTVTLGAIHGLLPGGYLTVYDGDKKIGQVKVLTAFDVIAYVQPLQKSTHHFKSDYYSVIIE